MKRLFIGLILIVVLTLSANCSPVEAAREGSPSRALYSTAGGGTTVYLPLVTNEVPTSQNTSGHRQNALYLPYGYDNWLLESSIFWFGKVNSSENYVDVRTGYTNTHLFIQFEVFDRLLWYDTTPTTAELTNYDAISLYLRPSGVSGATPDYGSYRLVAQFRPDYISETGYRKEYRGDGSQWVAANVSYDLNVSYQGIGGFNQTTTDNRGWLMTFKIPFTSLGLTGKPADGSTWGMAATLYDRDAASGDPLPVKSWPESMNGAQPASWAELGFGLPVYTPALNQNVTNIQIRQGLNAVSVPDASIGGSTICGDITKPDFFSRWGDLPESAYINYTMDNTQVNIQNQGNVADWPCFAKYYITFPLDALPEDKVIVSANLVLSLFGNSDPNYAETSWIQVMVTDTDWDESTLTWNNAPLVTENFAARYVDPLGSYPGDQGVKYSWDISSAVARAYAAGQPLRLIVYSSDLSKHSGKYFFASENNTAGARPTLSINYGDPLP